MNRHDLLKLKESIYSLGETISEQEGFYREVNRFLGQVYPALPNAAVKASVKAHLSSLRKNYWATPSVGEQTSRTSVLSL